MDNIFWSTCPTEMLWYSKLKYNQPGVHFCHYYKSSGPPYTFIASILKLLLVLAFLSFDMQEGAGLKKDFKPHWKKVIFWSQIMGWNPIVHWWSDSQKYLNSVPLISSIVCCLLSHISQRWNLCRWFAALLFSDRELHTRCHYRKKCIFSNCNVARCALPCKFK